MQTKTIFRPALALLLCGAAMLGLGLWSSAAGQGQTPILFSENPQGFNECISNYGVFAPVGDDGDAQCTPRPPGWTPPPPPSGVEVDEPATPSPPESARAAVPIFNPPGEPLDYDNHQTCDKFGGDTEPAAGFPGRHICSNIDINDTFCIVGSKDALPCKGLYDHVLRCNHYNRSALDPFHCAESCGGKFACGNRCREASIGAPLEVYLVPSDPAPENLRPLKLFNVTMAAGIPGEAHYELLQDGVALTLSPDATIPNRAGVWLTDHADLLRFGAQYEGTVRAMFSCAGLEAKHGEARFSFRVTPTDEFPWPPLPSGLLRTDDACGIIRFNDESHFSIDAVSCDAAE